MTTQNTTYVLDSKQRSSGSIQAAVFSLVSAGNVEVGTYDILSYSSVRSEYNVDASNQNIWWDEGAADLTAVLTPGNYTAATLAVELKAVMDPVSASTFTITYSAVTNKFTFVIAAGTFRFKYLSNTTNVARVPTGFLALDGVLAGTQVSDSNVNLSTYSNIVLDIAEDSQQDVTLLSGSEHSVIVPLTGAYGSPYTFLRNTEYSHRVRFATVLNQLNVSQFMVDGSVPVNPSEYVLVLRKLF